MLDLMRKHARSWLIKVALGGIAIVFIFFFGWGDRAPTDRNVMAEVNGEVITYDRYRAAYDREVNLLRLRFGGTIPPEVADKEEFKKKVRDQLIDETLIAQEAKRLGFFVTDEDLVESIRNNPVFQIDGRFDQRKYDYFVRDLKLSLSGFEQLMREQLLREQLIHVLSDGVKINPQALEQLWHFAHDKLTLSFLVIKPTSEKQGTTLDQEKLETYFKENQKKYTIPANADVEYVAFSWRDLQGKVEVTEDEIKSYYEANPREFFVPEKARLRHILLKAPRGIDKAQADELQKKLEDIRARIKGPEDFSAIASTESQDQGTASKGGDLGWVDRGTLGPELEKVAFDLKVGEVSQPVRSELGFHLFLVEEKTPEKELKLEEVKDQIKNKKIEDKAGRKALEDSEKFYEQVYRSEDLAGPAEKFGFKVQKAEAVGPVGNLPGLGVIPEAAKEIFRLNTGEISKMIRSGDTYVLIKLLKKTEPRLPSLGEVRGEVERDFRKDQALGAARAEAEKVIEALQREPTDPDAVAKKFNLEWQKLEPLTRETKVVPRLGDSAEVEEMLTTVSEATPLYPSPLLIPDGVAVVRLVGVHRASDEEYAKEADEFKRWGHEVRQTEILIGWLKVLKDKAQIKMMSDKL
ncbi:MAG: SurA N-terminal domain-containing protein [Thermodesulfobacteriota bacterium]